MLGWRKGNINRTNSVLPLELCIVVRAVLRGQSSELGFDLAWFNSLSSKHLCIFSLRSAIYTYFFCYIIYFRAPFSELSLVGLALDLCCEFDIVGWVM